jgi:hypothetical protein
MKPEGALVQPETRPPERASLPAPRFPVAVWWIIAVLLGLGAQVTFYLRLARFDSSVGQFGLANAVLGAIGLLAMPVLALHLAFRLTLAQRSLPDVTLRTLREAHPIVVENSAWIWGALCFPLVLLPWPLPSLPSFSLHLFELMNVFMLLGSIVALAACQERGRGKLWVVLSIAAAATRLAVGAGLVTLEPNAEAVLASSVVAGFITLSPALSSRPLSLLARLRASAVLLDSDFRRFTFATLSTALGVYLFTSADRIVGAQWFNVVAVNTSAPNLQLRQDLDHYQVAGWFVRAILWGAQPLLWLLYRERVGLTKSTARSIRHFWSYLGTVVAGLLLLVLFSRPGGPLAAITGTFAPAFALIAVLLALLQGLGLFCLASRCDVECHVFAACSILYGIFLAGFGHRPDILLSDMFGGALISLMVLLLVGVVRWGRRQP